MNTPFDRRRAEQFDDLLEGRVTEAPSGLSDLLAFAEQVWALPQPEPRAEFTADLRARLMAEAPAALASAGPVPDARLAPSVTLGGPGASTRRRLAAAAAVFTVAGAATGTAYAADSSLPGETLYPVKRLVESTQSALAFSDHAKGKAELERAATRLAEVTELAREGKTDRADGTLDEFLVQATKGSALLTDAGKGTEVHAFTQESLTQLDGLSGLVPDNLLSPVLLGLIKIDEATTTALPQQSGGITELPASLLKLLASAVGVAPSPSGPTKNAAEPAAPRPSAPATSAAPKPHSSTPATPKPTAHAATPKSTPSSVGEVVSGVGEVVGNGVVGGVGQTLGQVGETVGGPVGGVVSGLGETVSGVGGLVSDLLTGVGTLLTPPTK